MAFRNDRLGGRLNAILTAMRLARRYDAPLRIYWPTNEGSSQELHRPQDLFAQDFIDQCFVDRAEGQAGVRSGIELGTVSPGVTEAQFRELLREGRLYLSNSAGEQLRLPFEPPAVLNDLTALLHDMPFSPRVREMINRIDAILGSTSFRSYHLRRGDIIDDTALASHNLWSTKYIPRVIYEWHIRRELATGDGKIIVFSDALAEARAFAALSARVTSFADLIGDEELTDLQRDFLELYTMSRSEKIFAPPSSAFSGIAAVIGNKKVTDIEADLSVEDRQLALDELVDRLENRPEVFLSQSDLGQNFPFITAHLSSRGQSSRAQSIILNHLEQGLDRAYVYPFLSEGMLAEGNLDGIDRLLEIMQTRTCFREEHWGTVFAHAALADFLRGDLPRGIRRYHVAQWFHPINKLVTEIFWYLVATGDLDSARTYPFDQNLFRRTAHSLPVDRFPILGALVTGLTDADKRQVQYPSNMEVRDWRRLMGKKLNLSFANHSKIERQIAALVTQFRKAPDAAAFHSATGVLHCATENWPAAQAHLETALEKDPDNPLYLRRLAMHRSAIGSLDEAVLLLEEAVRISGGHICYRAELALTCLDAGMKARYNELMLGLREERTDLIEVRVLVTDHMRRNRATLPELLAQLQDLESLAPGSSRILTMKSKAYELAGHFDEALAILRQLLASGRPEAVIRTKVEGLVKSYRRRHDDAAATRWCQENRIDAAFGLG